MRSISVFIWIILITLSSCGKEPLPIALLLTNPSDRYRADEPFILTPKDLHNPSGDTLMWPLLRFTESGRLLPSQIEDWNKDKKWDELVFVYDFKPGDSVRLSVDWVLPIDYPKFPMRTGIRLAKKQPTSDTLVNLDREAYGANLEPQLKNAQYPYRSILWESDKMAFRHHFIGRNTRGVLGKRTTQMILDSIRLAHEGKLSELAPNREWWGGDLLYIGRSTGLGGLAVCMPDNKVKRLGIYPPSLINNVDSTVFTLLSEGPIRSTFRLDFYNWHLSDTVTVSLSQKITIWAGQSGYENQVITHDFPSDFYLMTGIPTYMLKRNPIVRIYDEGYTAAMTFDKQDRNRNNHLGMAIVVPEDHFEKPLPIPVRPDEDVQKQCSVLLKTENEKPLEFYVYAVWDEVDEDFESTDYFERFVRDRIRYMQNPIRVEVIYPPQE